MKTKKTLKRMGEIKTDQLLITFIIEYAYYYLSIFFAEQYIQYVSPIANHNCAQLNYFFL